jgi:Terminase RNaseH-like domain/Terminase large subunit, T4likevirus-type, N-terminal
MILSTHKLRKLEATIQKKSNKTQANFVVPDKWEDFANLVSVRSAGNIVKFSPYNYQTNLVNLMLERSVIVAKSRQLGISETITCFMLWRACLNPGYLGVVFSKTQIDTGLLARRMKRMINSLGLKTVTENLGDIELQGRGRILFKNSNPDSARGIESVVDCFFDEFAFVQDGKFIYDAVAPAQQMLGDKARVFIVSTPNRKTNFYWDLLSGNNEGKDVESICKQISEGCEKPFQHWTDTSGWGKVIIHWKEHPLYGQNANFLNDVHEKQKLDWETIKQEYDLNFEESAENVFNAELVRLNAIGKYESDYDENADYYCGLDCSTFGADYTAFSVIKYLNNKYSLVALYRKRQETSDFHQYKISQIIELYKPTRIGIETTGGVGAVYLEQLSRQHRSISFEAVKTTGDTKPAMISNLLLALERQVIEYPPNTPLIDELLSFRKNGKKLESPSGKHDDVLMSVCFGLCVSPFNKGHSIWNI